MMNISGLLQREEHWYCSQ